MKIHSETISEFGHVIIHLGEAAVLGGTAALVIQSFSLWFTLGGIVGGFIMVFLGLYFVNKSHSQEQKS
jgi:formate/nitrite transporter FocA (FNT family)